MTHTKTAIALVIAIVAVLCVAGCTGEQPSTGGETEVEVIYSATGPMPMLLSTDQIDGYMAWQPFVAVATVSGIGKVVSYSQDLPPAGMWTDHTCCALTAREDQIQENADLVNAFSALMIAADDYIIENPDRAAEISADWLYGGDDMTFGDVTVSSVEVLKESIPTLKFTTEPSEAWITSNDNFVVALRDLGYITGSLKDADDAEVNSKLFDFGPYEQAKAMIANGTIATPADAGTITVGYLPSDHHAPLFVAIKEWEYFEKTYGIALKPASEGSGAVDNAELFVNGVKVANVKLVKGEGGSQLMTLAAQDTLQIALVGTPPAITAIDKGTPIKILHPLQTEGSGLVVSADAPADDWQSFIAWAEQRAAEGKPLKIASPPKGSIQDVQLRAALGDSNVVVKEAQ
ncbi:ABC transporter substrate-binding protein [Methanofollis fontis]|uniref:ABC transporter substrate-binding protein n=1 Tax=Methanofollis fontis TaxID=2052832 RepID=A0A483CUL9_9EURY|nr:ABC transporter substrate-binding protein [Methanofollis fontis]TAJ44627.1 hypothetical protein CUJ86_04795 [Methanofollis fontis]